MILAVASGKGGTGKTTVALSLARTAPGPAWYVDSDVEAPNGHLFLRPDITARETSTVMYPAIDRARCTSCGKCRDVCRYNAIAVLPRTVMVFEELCHGCAGCVLVCPEQAMSEVQRPIGTVELGTAGDIAFAQGTLNVGEAMSPPLIRDLRRRLPAEGLFVIDAPPGTSCPAIAAIRGADACLLVTEPTPFGLHDLKLAVATVRELGLPHAVVINRDGIGDDRVEAYCHAEGIAVVARIPESRAIATAYARGRLAVDAVPELAPVFAAIWRAVGAAPPHFATAGGAQ